MKKVVSIVMLLALLFSFAVCSVSCGGDSVDEDDSGIALVIIAGKHGNANWDDKHLEIAKQYMQRAFTYTHENEQWSAVGNISVIVSDGDPKKAALNISNDKANVDFNNISFSKRTARAAHNNARDVVDSFVDAIDFDGLNKGSENLFKLCADDPEVDLLGALSEAQSILNNNKYKKVSEKHILIIDSGISTAGDFNMCETSFVGENYGDVVTAEDIVSQIPATAFPDLDHMNVTFLGLGNVADPQMAINRDNELKTLLEDVWTKIIKEKCHGDLTETIQFSENTGLSMEWNADGSGDYPSVTPVDFTRPSKPDNTPKPDKDTVSLDKAEPFTSEKLGFIKDEPNFVNRKAAIDILSARVIDMKEYLKACPDKKVFVVGSIAKVDRHRDFEDKISDYPPYLSQSRADAVADILINDYGIPKSSLVVIGSGVIKFSWRNAKEISWFNKMDDEEAKKNRVVNIFAETSKERDELIKQKKNVC